MLNYSIKRVLGMIPILLIVAVLVSLFVHLLSGDPTRLATGPEADETTVDLVRKDLGLNKPMHEQFMRFFANAAHGEFGNSICTKRPVSEEIGERFWPVLNLTITSMVWTVVFGIMIGITSTMWHNKRSDHLGMALAVSGISFLAFTLGILLMEMFSVQLDWLPPIGADSQGRYILPSLTLGAAVAAVVVRFTRTSFMEVLQEDFVRTTHVKGVHETVVVIKHCLRSATIPVVAMIGLRSGFLLSGSIVIERVFNWPDLGRLFVDTVEVRDCPVIQTEVLLFSLEFILIDLMVDMLYIVTNPTIRYEG